MRQTKHIPKWRLVVWIGVLLSLLVSMTYALIVVKPKAGTVDCVKVLKLWDYYEGEAAIATFKGEDMKAKLLKSDYLRLVMGPAKVCFPTELVDYLVQNG